MCYKLSIKFLNLQKLGRETQYSCQFRSGFEACEGTPGQFRGENGEESVGGGRSASRLGSRQSPIRPDIGTGRSFGA